MPEFSSLSVFLFLTAAWFRSVISLLPPPVVSCSSSSAGCSVTNAYGTWNTRQRCQVSEVVYPSSEQELMEAVANAARNRVKMKAVSHLSHAIPPLVCPGGDHGMVISTANLSKSILVDNVTMTVQVDAGVQLDNLFDELARFGLTIPASPYWNGLSVAGTMATASHGSGRASALHDHVLEVRIVVPGTPENTGARLLTLTEADGDRFYAALVSLGTLGVISSIKLRVEPLFKRSVTNKRSSDEDLEQRLLAFGAEHEFGDVTWYPSKREVVYRIDDRVSLDSRGDGVNEYLGFQPTVSAVVEGQRALEEQLEAGRSTSGKCLIGSAQVSVLQNLGYGFKSSKGGIFTGYPVVGLNHKMQSAGGCQRSSSKLTICPWDSSHRGLFYHEAGFTIANNKIVDFISDVKKLRDEDPARFCGVDLYAGILLRFLSRSKALLGKQFDGVDVGFTYFRSRDPSQPRLDMDIWDEIEQMGLFKYGALPHWGKNKPYVFATTGAGSLHPRLADFVQVKRDLDPLGLFSSEWSNLVLGGGSGSDSVHCALEGNCLCSRDEHCAPAKGYYCRSGRVFTAARVCRFESTRSF